MTSTYLGRLRDIPRVLISERYSYTTCKEVSECSGRVWKGPKRWKPRCESPSLPGRSAAVNKTLLRFRDAGHDFCVSSGQFWTGETARECWRGPLFRYLN